MDSTPKADGFYMPSELARHRCTYLLWPEREDNWRFNAEYGQAAFKEVIQAIAKYEPVVVGVDKSQYLNLLEMNMPNVQIVEISNNDSWIRDTGATFVVDGFGRMRAVDFKFNATAFIFLGIKMIILLPRWRQLKQWIIITSPILCSRVVPFIAMEREHYL
jgi:agmatine deiminase